jgi:hypothetical protein
MDILNSSAGLASGPEPSVLPAPPLSATEQAQALHEDNDQDEQLAAEEEDDANALVGTVWSELSFGEYLPFTPLSFANMIATDPSTLEDFTETHGLISNVHNALVNLFHCSRRDLYIGVRTFDMAKAAHDVCLTTRPTAAAPWRSGRSSRTTSSGVSSSHSMGQTTKSSTRPRL